MYAESGDAVKITTGFLRPRALIHDGIENVIMYQS